MNNAAFLIPFHPTILQRQHSLTHRCPQLKTQFPRPSLAHIRCLAQEPLATSEPKLSAGAVVEKFWQITNTGVFTDTLPLFTDNAVYHDTLYPSPFVGKSAIQKHLQNMNVVLPKGVRYVLDDLADGEQRVGARWHVETPGGTEIPLSRGASMYTVVEEDGEMKIKEAWDFIETPFKVAAIILPVLAASAKILSALKPKNTT